MAHGRTYLIIAIVAALVCAIVAAVIVRNNATNRGAAAAPAEEATGARPQVFVFVLDGLDGDEYDRGTLPYVKELVEQRGTYYQQSRSVMVAETNPNHTAMVTGAYTDTSGIAGNDYVIYPKSGETTEGGCPLDNPKMNPGPADLAPGCVKAQTFFESTAAGSDPNAVTTAGVFGKPKLATLFAAKRADGTYAADYLWTPCPASKKGPNYCRKVPVNIQGYADDATTMDAVLAVARDGIKSEDGTIKMPDLTFVNLPQIDSTGHASGVGTRYRNAIANAQIQLQRFVDQQKQLGRWDNTVMILVSDHAMDSTPTKTSLAARLVTSGVPSSKYQIVQNGSVDMVYLNDRNAADKNETLKKLRTTAAKYVRKTRVDEVLYREPNPSDGGAAYSVDSVHPEWRMSGKWTGDLIVTHDIGGAFTDPVNPLLGNHGSPYTTDNFTAIVGGWPGIKSNGTLTGTIGPRFDDSAANPNQSENVDIASTVTKLLNQAAPSQSRGRFLSEAFNTN